MLTLHHSDAYTVFINNDGELACVESNATVPVASRNFLQSAQYLGLDIAQNIICDKYYVSEIAGDACDFVMWFQHGTALLVQEVGSINGVSLELVTWDVTQTVPQAAYLTPPAICNA